MKQTANPGGILAPQEIVGRDQLIKRLWRILEKRSVYITAERRMGKTSIVRDKMGKEPAKGVLFLYTDVSRAASPLEFVELLLNEGREHFDLGKKAKRLVGALGRFASNLELTVPGVKVKLPAESGSNWKTLLESLLHDLTDENRRIVLAFDELPLMLNAIKRAEEKAKGAGNGEGIVMEILDTLRAARQENADLRMIYTGSLGLHHVLTSLREQGYQNDPTNDMTLVEVEPLAEKDATELSIRLLLGEEIPCADVETSAAHLAKATDGMPYYIQHLVDGMVTDGEDGEPETIDRLLEERLTDLRDPWHLGYYDERIDTHYPEPLRAPSRAILDQLAPIEGARSFEELQDGIDPEKAARDEDTVRAALRLLGLDNYLSKGKDGGYRFRYPFIARVWQLLRK